MEFDSESARMYNYKSTLENHSVSHALALADEMRLFSKVPRNAAKDIKLAIIDLVLATDMAHHFDLVSSFSSLVCTQYQMEGATSRIDKGVTRGILNKRNSQAIETAPFRPLHSDFQRQPEGVRMLILKVALKLSDLGHCYLPWEDHSEWCKRLEAEFFAQGDTERSLGRKVSPLMDRELPGACDPANQNVFFKMFLLPMLELWVSLYPSCQPLLDQALANLNKRMASG